MGHLDGVQCFSQGTNLVELDQNGIGNVLIYAFLEDFGIGDKQVIPLRTDQPPRQYIGFAKRVMVRYGLYCLLFFQVEQGYLSVTDKGADAGIANQVVLTAYGGPVVFSCHHYFLCFSSPA